jgi:hypothetical protein
VWGVLSAAAVGFEQAPGAAADSSCVLAERQLELTQQHPRGARWCRLLAEGGVQLAALAAVAGVLVACSSRGVPAVHSSRTTTGSSSWSLPMAARAWWG